MTNIEISQPPDHSGLAEHINGTPLTQNGEIVDEMGEKTDSKELPGGTACP